MAVAGNRKDIQTLALRGPFEQCARNILATGITPQSIPLATDRSHY
jgi:hypothetical protein